MPVVFTQIPFMHDQTEQTLLAKLAEHAGIATDYHDIAGNLCTSPLMTPDAPF